MSEEKKLTDEEIAKAILQSIEYSKTITYFDEWGNCKSIFVKDALDLIHRLQDENAGLKERGENVINMLHETIADQKVEIEQLTKRHERIAWSKKQYLDWVHGFLTTHTDMKDRDEDCQMFDRDWMCGVFWAKIEGAIEYIIDLEKQVDELKERAKLDLECEKKWGKLMKEQAVKETAEKFAERVKMAFYYHFDELIPSIMADKIDEICKEITESK